MTLVAQAFQRLFGGREQDRPGQELLQPEARLEHIEENIRAMTSIIHHDQALELDRSIGNELTDVEIYADRIHLQKDNAEQSQMVLLDDSLTDYNLLEEEIRCQLARKITRLLPQIANSKKKMVLEHTIRVLKILATDQSERVRQMLAQELCDLPNAPYDVVHELAWDPSLKVSCPILEFSTLLRDEDLIDIITQSGIPGTVEAIARRKTLSDSVGEAIADTKLPAAIGQLLQNPNAHLSEQAMNSIVEQAPLYEFWHDMLVRRPELTHATVNRIAGFVSQHLLNKLEAEGKLGKRHKQDTKIAVNHRLKSWTAEQERNAELRARQLYQAGKLNDELIGMAIAEVNEPFVIAAIALMAQMPTDTAKRIIRSQSGSAITALAWKAGLTMRTAMGLQMKIGKVHHTKMLNARGGTDYPISEFEMQTYLEIFTG
jgi:uncharacterized protein (DUF2336 family)